MIGCRYNGVDFRTGEEFDDPFDPCQRCECQVSFMLLIFYSLGEKCCDILGQVSKYGW